MGYLVLARKYRPQAFVDMTGQEHVVQTLSNALRSGRVAHALLFCGPRGCGKTTTARIVAKALNCANGPTPEPCGVCTPCREITAGTDVDVQEIDAASNTGVDNVRELRESAKYLPARDRFKIFIVDEVHMLSKAAFNAFLKTLEEPPGHVKFLFATTDPQALPDTILSRCQRHNFRLVPLKQISERIRSIARAENVAIDDGAVALVARQAAGSMRDSLSILDQLFSSVGVGVAITEAMAAQALGALDRSVVWDLAAALLARDPRGVLEGVSRAFDGGHDLKRLAEDLATHVRNLLAASVAGAPLDLPDHELRALRDQSANADPVELARLFDLVHGALFDISRAGQPRHALEIALLKAVYLAPATSVQALLGRADELARKLGVEPLPPGGGGARSGGPVRPRPGFEGGGGSVPSSGGSVRARFEAVPVAAAARLESPGADGIPHTAGPSPVVVAAPLLVVAAPPAAVVPAAVAAAPPRPQTVPWAPATAATALVDAGPAVPPSAAVAVSAPPPGPAASGLERKPWERHLSLVSGGAVSAAEPAQAGRPSVPATVAAAEPRTPAGHEPAPTAGPPGAVAGLAPGAPAELVGRWPSLVEGVRGRRRALGSLLEHARPLALEQGELTLGFARGDFHAQGLADEKGAIAALLTELMGSPIRLHLVELSAEQSSQVASLAESLERAERDARDARLKQGREHPAIVQAAALLGAEIEDVRDLGGVAP